MRLDRFLKHRLDRDPELRTTPINNTLINKWLRKRHVKLVPGAHDPASAGHLPASTVTTGTTRTEAGQLWRVRVLHEIPASTTGGSTTPTTPSTTSTSTITAAAASEDETFLNNGSGNRLQRDTETTGQLLLPLQDWIVYKDSRIIMLNKPAGVAVQGGTGVQSSIDSSLSVLQQGFPDRPRLVHRLDRTTSGLLILARTRKAAQDLTKRFHDGTTGAGDNEEDRESGLQKMYIAIVRSASSTSIAGKMYEDRDGDEDRSTDGLSRLSGEMVIIKQGKQERIEIRKDNIDLTETLASSGPVWPSVTDFCIASQSFYKGMHYSVLRLYPRTGRKHQLRVHCAQLLKAPILGDTKYAESKDMPTADESKGRIHLHMAEIALKGWTKDKADKLGIITGQHPGDNRNCTVLEDGTLVVRAPLPGDMKRAMQRLGLHCR
ncbi:hypothetical protein BGZ68_008061 [Mortierella alpina]|nr:hypothetical protein BGZ68_008061 [Mortierella alpina]